MEEQIRVVSYERVSTSQQADRDTILAQADELDARLKSDESRVFLRRYQDEAFSGALAMDERPEGARLLADAAKGLFDEVWVFKTDRLGRDDIDPLVVRRDLERLGVRLRALHDNIDGQLEYAMRVAFAAEELRTIKLRTRAGMNSASRQGRYLGGIVAHGFKIETRGEHDYIVPDEEPAWGGLSAADIVRRIFRHLAEDGWSCRRIAKEFNRLGIPTAYQKAGRGVRGKRTQGLWRPGRIRNLARNPAYRGRPEFGKRPNDKKVRPQVFSGNCPRLVSDEIWFAAQDTLTAHKIMPNAGKNTYMLRGLIHCGECGLHFCGSRGRGDVIWYRCNGYLVERGPTEGRCQAKAVKGEYIEPPVWSDIERWMRSPGDILAELASEIDTGASQAVAAAERLTLKKALAELAPRRDRVIDLFSRDLISQDELQAQFSRIEADRQAIEEKLRSLEEQAEDDEPPLDTDSLLETLRQRLDAGLTDEERQRICQLLVRRITINTTVLPEGGKEAKALVEYRFPAVGSSTTGRGSWPPPA